MTDSTPRETGEIQEVDDFTSDQVRTLLVQGWHAYCTAGNLVYEYTFTPHEQVAHHLQEQMMTTSSRQTGLPRPPSRHSPVRVASASKGKMVGPFDHLLVTRTILTANEIRKHFSLAARHGRNPQ